MAALLLAGAALWAAGELNASMQWVDQTDRVIGQSRRLLKLTVDMETGERGYLVTGNDVFLQPYREASNVVDSEYQELYQLVADNPQQQSRLKRLHESLSHWRGYAEQMIVLRRTGGAYADLKINLSGKAEIDEIRDQIAGFQSVEEPQGAPRLEPGSDHLHPPRPHGGIGTCDLHVSPHEADRSPLRGIGSSSGGK
jgi:CHASE3 domain sensor protein